MKRSIPILFLFLCIFCILERLKAAKILILLPMPFYSHQIPFRPLFHELYKRGHEVTLVAPNPMKNVNATNLKQIDLGYLYKKLNYLNFVRKRLNHEEWIDFMNNHGLEYTAHLTESVLNNTEFKKIYGPDSEETFDLVMIEMFFSCAFFALGHRFDAPMIGLRPMPLSVFDSYMLGGIALPSHDSTYEMESRVGSNLSFWKRLSNFARLWRYIYLQYSVGGELQQALTEEYFGKSVPPVHDLLRNISVIFSNEDLVMSYARPELQNVIRFHAIHIKERLEPLPKDLQKFVDGATNGFIYFCMGTNVKFQDFPESTKQIFFDVFKKLPYRIVLKNEVHISSLPENVYLASWFPQQTILAHPNIKLYMYQGGLQSSQEAIHFGVPVLGFPVVSDQEFQLKKIEAAGIGRRLLLETLNREDLESVIREMTSNKQYKKNIIKIKNLVEDTPYDMTENLVWWTEYVIRHKGAPHLQTNLAWVPWYQHTDMDIIAFLSVAIFLTLSMGIWITLKLLQIIYKQSQDITKNPKEKTM